MGGTRYRAIGHSYDSQCTPIPPAEETPTSAVSGMQLAAWRGHFAHGLAQAALDDTITDFHVAMAAAGKEGREGVVLLCPHQVRKGGVDIYMLMRC